MKGDVMPTVKIKAEQIVHYEKIIQLDEDDLSELKSNIERNDWIDDLDLLFLDVQDIEDAESISNEDIELYILENKNWVDAITGQPSESFVRNHNGHLECKIESSK